MAKMAAKCVVDTNVPKIANQHINMTAIPVDMLECVLACVEKIQNIIDGKLSLILDEGGEIFAEYRQQLSMSGQPGIGDAFMQWVHDNQWTKCDRITITKTGNGYGEFPDSAELKKFDKSDIKFVAVANAHSTKPPILVAIDRGWWNHKKALKDAGINIEFLCPAQIQQASARKTKRK